MCELCAFSASDRRIGSASSLISTDRRRSSGCWRVVTSVSLPLTSVIRTWTGPNGVPADEPVTVRLPLAAVGPGDADCCGAATAGGGADRAVWSGVLYDSSSTSPVAVAARASATLSMRTPSVGEVLGVDAGRTDTGRPQRPPGHADHAGRSAEEDVAVGDVRHQPAQPARVHRVRPRPAVAQQVVHGQPAAAGVRVQLA